MTFIDTLIRLVWKIGILVSVIILILAIILYIKQESLLYFPSIGGVPRRPSQNPRRYRSPSEHGIPFETHLIPCADGTAIHSWLLYHPSIKTTGVQNKHSQQEEEATVVMPSSRPTIIFFHGNAGNIGLRLPNAIQMYHTLNVHVWLIEYRGYGDSDDVTPNEVGLKMDAEAVWNHVHSIHSNSDANSELVLGHDGTRGNTRSSSIGSALRTVIDPRKMIVFGQSLGGAVAFHLAQYAQSKESTSTSSSSSSSSITITTTDAIEKNNIIYPPLAGIIVENTFLSISKMVDHLMPYLTPIKLFVLRMQWNTEHIVSNIRIPTLFMAGKLDTLVPHFHMLTLYERMRTRMWMKGGDKDKRHPMVRLHVVENGTHNETWMQGGHEYWRAMRQFLEEVFAHEMPEGVGEGAAAIASVGTAGVGSNHDRSLNGVEFESSRSSLGDLGCGVNDGPFLRKPSTSLSSAEYLTESKTAATATTLRKNDPVEIELGGEDAAGMISSVNSILGMAREAATRSVGVAAKGGGGGGVGGGSMSGADTYKKKD